MFAERALSPEPYYVRHGVPGVELSHSFDLVLKTFGDPDATLLYELLMKSARRNDRSDGDVLEDVIQRRVHRLAFENFQATGDESVFPPKLVCA